jgi:hypothetical protein
VVRWWKVVILILFTPLMMLVSHVWEQHKHYLTNMSSPSIPYFACKPKQELVVRLDFPEERCFKHFFPCRLNH